MMKIFSLHREALLRITWGGEYYGLGMKPFTRMAREAGAVYKIGKKVLISREIFEAYLRANMKKEDEEDV